MTARAASAAAAPGPVSLERLADALASVQRQCPELAVVAIRWMHLRHPLQHVQEEFLRGGRRRGAGAAALLARCAQGVLYAGYCWIRLGWLRLRARQALTTAAGQPFDLIVKTWVRDLACADRADDFYFGDLQRRLAEREVRVLMLCGNVAGDGWAPFAQACARAPTPRLSELCLLPLSAPLRMLAQQWRARRRLRRLAARAPDALVRRICHAASHACLAPDTARAGFYYWIGQAAAQTWQPRAILGVYEAQGWEQAFRWGVKTAEASCRVIGYQHALLFPEALSLLSPPRTPGLPVHPDVVLCLGAAPRNRLRPGHEPYGARLVPFGSFWYRAPGIAEPAAPSKRMILVVPEGHPSAVQELFRFASACAPRMPGYTFLLRCHPAFPMTRGLQSVLGGVPRQPNVVFSDGRTIEEECAWSSAVLYRGSAAVLYAVLHGLLPVYLDLPGGYDQDPLGGLPGWHARCATPDDLAAVMARHEARPQERLEADWQSAAQQLNACTGPVTDAHLEALMEAAGLAPSGRVGDGP